MAKVLLDNDVLSKCAMYSLLDEVAAIFGETLTDIGILGSARFVLTPKRLKSSSDGPDAAHKRLLDFIGKTQTIEPSEEETALAIVLEKAAIEEDVQLDAGESQLCAVAITRASNWISTGDKRAIKAIETLRSVVTKLKALDHKIICLEMLIAALVKDHGHGAIRFKVCGSKGADGALEVCFQCHNSEAEAGEIDKGIKSYVNALRRLAPNAVAVF
jgi:hypothetical protein